MALLNLDRGVMMLVQKLLADATLKQHDIYNYVTNACLWGTAYYTYYYSGWQPYNPTSSFIAEDDLGYRYYNITGSTLQGYYQQGNSICRDGPTDNYYPALSGISDQQFTVTLNQDGTPETIPYNSNKFANYTGYPVIACLSIQGDDWPIACGIASELTATACSSACGLNNKSVDITINIS
jgi:hypothetical protein